MIATCGPGYACPSRAPEIPRCWWDLCCLVCTFLCCVLVLFVFCLFLTFCHWVVRLSFTHELKCPFGIFFLHLSNAVLARYLFIQHTCQLFKIYIGNIKLNLCSSFIVTSVLNLLIFCLNEYVLAFFY